MKLLTVISFLFFINVVNGQKYMSVDSIYARMLKDTTRYIYSSGWKWDSTKPITYYKIGGYVTHGDTSITYRNSLDTIKCKLLISVGDRLKVVSGYKLLRIKFGEKVVDKNRKADGYLNNLKQPFDNNTIVWIDKPY